MTTSDPGWYPDPFGRFEYRYFDGQHWTQQVSTRGMVSTDLPVMAPAPSPDRIPRPEPASAPSDTSTILSRDASPADQVVVITEPESRERDRLTVFLRPVLVVPLVIVGVGYRVAAWFAAALAWFALVATGRYPAALRGFVAGYLGFLGRLRGFGGLLTDRWPQVGRGAGEFPIEVHVPGPKPAYRRLGVVFRPVLAIPVLCASLLYGLIAVGVTMVSWFSILFTGRQTEEQRRLLRGSIAYRVKATGYVLLVTESRPPFWEEESEERAQLAGVVAPRPRANVGEWIAGLAGMALFVMSVAVEWYEVRQKSRLGRWVVIDSFLRLAEGRFLGLGWPHTLNAFVAYGALTSLLLLAAGMAGIGLWLVGASGGRERLPTSVRWGAVCVGGLATAVVGLRVISPPAEQYLSLGVRAGAVLGLALVTLLTLGAGMSARSTRGRSSGGATSPLHLGEILGGVGGIALVVSMVAFDWYAIEGRSDIGTDLSSVNGVDAFWHYGVLSLIPLAAATLGVVLMLLGRVGVRQGLSVPLRALTLVLGTMTVALIGVRLAVPPELRRVFFREPDYTIATLGPILGLISTAALMVGTWLSFRTAKPALEVHDPSEGRER